jgi:hypothetical protein
MCSSRPEWMEGGVRRPKAQARTFVPEAPRERVVVQGATHRNVVVGVTLLALVSLFSIFFWLTIVLVGLVNPPDPFEGVLTWGRVLIATVAGAFLSAMTWRIADSEIDA